MNKQQIIEQINELKQKIEEFEKEVNSIEFEGIKKGVRQRPKIGERYFYVDSCCVDSFCGIDYVFWQETKTDLFLFNTGNCFKTEQEAEDYKENLLTRQALKDLALELNDGVEICWKDKNQPKFYINYYSLSKTLSQDFSKTIQGTDIVCLNENFLTIAKDRIGEEKLIKLIKSGV